MVGTAERSAAYGRGRSVRASATPSGVVAMRKAARTLEACSRFSVSKTVAGSGRPVSGTSVDSIEIVPALFTITARARWSSS